MDNYTKLLETNLLTLRKSFSGWSLDNFVVSTIALNYETPSLSFFKPNQNNLANGEFFV